MKALILVTLLFGSGQFAFISENVVFDKINDITTSRSKWLVSFVSDLKPFERFIERLSHDLVATAALAQQVVKQYGDSGKENFMNIFTSLRNEFRLLTETHTYLRDTFLDYKRLHNRNKRAAIPIIGKMMNFLFGTLTEEDVSSIKNNIRVLAENQNKISHVLSENLSILNVTRIEVSQNRQAINSLIGDLNEIDDKLENITQEIERQIVELGNFVQLYVQLDLITGELKLLIQKAMTYLEHLSSQLNMLSLGHLSPSVISPTNLKQLLKEISDRLPRYLELFGNPNKDMWFFYRFLTCTTILYDDKILTVILIPLLDANNKFEIYRTYNLPLPMKSNNPKLLTMVAKYEIDVEYFAVNAERSKYILFKKNEVEKCTDPFIKFCKIISPVYPINLSKNCVISLFMKKENEIEKFCKIIVEPSSILPMANYISSGSWLVTTDKPLSFAIACHNSKYKTTSNKIIYPPLNILTLNETCTATNDYMSLLPFYNRQTKYTVTDDSLANLISDYNLTSRKLWKPFDQVLPRINLTGIPKELRKIKEIPMDDLIGRLKSLGQISNDSSIPNWVYTLIYVSVALLAGVIIFLICKFKNRLGIPCSAKREGSKREKSFAAKYDEMGQLVSVKTEGDVTTFREAASAPLIGNLKDDATNNNNNNNVYPVLKLPLVDR